MARDVDLSPTHGVNGDPPPHLTLVCQVPDDENRVDLAVVGDVSTTVYRGCSISGYRRGYASLRDIRAAIYRDARDGNDVVLVTSVSRDRDVRVSVEAHRCVVLAFYPAVTSAADSVAV